MRGHVTVLSERDGAVQQHTSGKEMSTDGVSPTRSEGSREATVAHVMLSKPSWDNARSEPYARRVVRRQSTLAAVRSRTR